MDLQIVWFILVTVLFVGFFFLEGFDYGVGTILPFFGKDDTERRMLINTIGPVWDGNEVWMITAGGAMFAAFPHVYATMFSMLYMALFLMLLGLIVRGVAFEFRSKHECSIWRNLWDWLIFIGSALPAFLWGVAVTNMMKGFAINGEMIYKGTFWDLLSLYTIIGGIAFLLVFAYHGTVFLTLRLADTALIERLRKVSVCVGGTRHGGDFLCTLHGFHRFKYGYVEQYSFGYFYGFGGCCIRNLHFAGVQIPSVR